MALYKCSECGKEIDPNLLRKRVRCPYCGSKVLLKQRLNPKKLKAV